MSEHEDPQSNRVRVPFPPVNRRLTAGVEMFVCPVIGCDWRKTVAEVELAVAHVPIRGRGPTLNDAIGEALVARAKATDAILREHLESHDVIDFVRTIRDLEQQVYNAGHTGVRPHRRTTADGQHELARQFDPAKAAEVMERYRQIDGE